jgi:ribosomal protein L11 methylase PrmA
MGAIKCLSLDIEADSVKASIKNSIDSEVSDKLKVEQQDLLKFINVGYKPNLIIANLNSFLFREGTDNILNVMSIGSLMIASGILSENLEEIENMFIRKKLEVLGVSRSGDWVTLLTRKVFNA